MEKNGFDSRFGATMRACDREPFYCVNFETLTSNDWSDASGQLCARRLALISAFSRVPSRLGRLERLDSKLEGRCSVSGPTPPFLIVCVVSVEDNQSWQSRIIVARDEHPGVDRIISNHLTAYTARWDHFARLIDGYNGIDQGCSVGHGHS
jgi:hypothetical protein